ncbi:hypothetical protein CRG98_046952 [Punica granatum]|uniref:Uncharacterized protein n=1 Tax=Punica granatum TaxID=22663 RepID=A0A2I0HLN8_PUNGR|nr:hypothetical protein CRG98_046952 [Punica granatum]
MWEVTIPASCTDLVNTVEPELEGEWRQVWQWRQVVGASGCTWFAQAMAVKERVALKAEDTTLKD